MVPNRIAAQKLLNSPMRVREEKQNSEMEVREEDLFDGTESDSSPETSKFSNESPRRKAKLGIEDEMQTERSDLDLEDPRKTSSGASENSKMSAENRILMERSKYIPLRLSVEERKLLKLLEAALNVSDYTGRVDILSYEKKSTRIQVQLKDIYAILSGLLVASDYKAGQQMIADRTFADNAAFFQQVFEVGRRYKVMNPEKMRTEYGKLVFLVQDSVIPEVQNTMGFHCKKRLATVYDYLKERNATAIFEDQAIHAAIMEVPDDKKNRMEVQRKIKEKERSVEYLSHRYKSAEISEEEIKLCLRSIGDNNSFLRFSRDPLNKMISYLTKYFQPGKIEGEFSLSIQAGRGGARLSHAHEMQYDFALQSMTLWRDILDDMFRLWVLAEEDLLDERNNYRLTNTGQGLNRVQAGPRTLDAMHAILSNVKRSVGGWVGSSVIHLGDTAVPSPLVFIDKYTQVTRIINPIILTLEEIETLDKNPNVHKFIESAFNGIENLRKIILCDFFRHAFDGSGADNFFDAGSCIDGRLTSAWNWCSKIHTKDYYVIFKMCGFIGFDGDFQR
eukprot:TRINITY_DN10267_c0_g1_i1.p1 TRINITY_DN10267_c0_g1~~TRINITY_DN10267_c0_g1_i1.p1  ORF type:complete len:561 (-),score=171.02 TRINITY_DN10267_c0_g1_i1:18-1700(-)